MDLQLTNKTALVTGSTAGIGFAIAYLFAQEGAAVVVNGRSQNRVDEAIERIRREQKDARVRGVAADLVLRFVITVTYSGGGLRDMGQGVVAEPRQEGCEIPTGESPVERDGDLLIVMLKGKQTFLDLGQRREIIGDKDLALDDREVNLDLIQPTGMQWGVHQHHRRPLGAESVGGLLAAVSRTVVHNPEDATGRGIGRLVHHLGDQAIHGPDSVFGLAAAK